MTLQELIKEIDQQPKWSQDGKRAPHKSLALLYALGQALQGNRLVRYHNAEPTLIHLLDRFGPPRSTQHPEQPVWRLRNYRGNPTSFWEIRGDLNGIEGAGGNPSAARMRDQISFGVSESACAVLCRNPENARGLARALAAELVPDTLQSSLLEATGFGPSADGPTDDAPTPTATAEIAAVLRTRVTATRVRRDPSFARVVMHAYGSACAVCAISPKLGSDRFGLEAAHIRWACAGGPDDIRNGLCLCRMHHDALDWGALKIDAGMQVRVSPRLEQNQESDAMFTRYEGREIRLPRNPADHPSVSMLSWHWEEVFKP
jgi:putative restriction endonuclease